MDAPCQCLEDASMLSKTIQQRDNTSCASIFEINRRFIDLWNVFIICTQCNFDIAFLHNCITINDKLLRFYEETSPILTTQRESHIFTQRPLKQISQDVSLELCHTIFDSISQHKTPLGFKEHVRSQIYLGKMHLDEEEGIILLRQLVSDNLTKLRTVMHDLRELSEELWTEKGGQQSKEISALDLLICQMLERTLAALGRLDQ